MENLFKTFEFDEYLFNSLDASVFVVDASRHVLRANEPFLKLFSVTGGKLDHMLFGNAVRCPSIEKYGGICGQTEVCSACPICKGIMNAAGTQKKKSVSILPWEFKGSGQPERRYLQFTIKPLVYGDSSYALGVIHDVSEIEEQKEQIKVLADHDFMTGLANRRYLFEVGESFFLTAKRGFLRLAVGMADIDFFKTVNDSYGHDAGDFVLKELASVMKSAMRRTDFIARYGGEEFCFLLEYRRPQDIKTVVEKLRMQIDSHEFVFRGDKMHITISIGVTVALADSLDSMISKADELLYIAKNSGRNRTETDAS